MKLQVGPVWGRVTYTAEEQDAVKVAIDALAWVQPGARFSRAYQHHAWDGRVKLYTVRDHRYPAGLTPVLVTAFQDAGYRPHVFRTPPPSAGPLPSLHGLTWTPAQTTALEVAREHPCGVIQMTVATGKGELIAGLTQLYSGPALVLVHTQDLLQQTYTRLQHRLPRTSIGWVGAGEWDSARVTVATYQTLRSQLDRRRTQAFLQRQQVVIADECHHAKADTFRAVMRHCPAPVRYGLSATAFERDPTGRPKTLQDAQLVGLIGELIHEYRAYQVPVTVQIAHLGATAHRTAPYEVAYEKDVLENELAHQLICKWVRGRVRQGQHGVILVTRKQHGQQLAAKLNAVYVDGAAGLEERTDVRLNFNARRLPVVVSTTIFDEGIDLPAMDWLVLADPGKASGRLIQRAGRAARSRPGKLGTYLLDVQITGHPKLEEHARRRRATYQQEGFALEDLGTWVPAVRDAFTPIATESLPQSLLT